MDTTIVVVGAVAALLAAILAFPAGWAGYRDMKRDEFTLSERKPGGVVVLTRTKKAPVQIRQTWVFGHGQIPATDARASTDWRMMRRTDDLILDVGGVVPGDVLLVEYRRVGKAELRLEREAIQSRDLRKLRDEKRGQLVEDSNAWTTWDHRVI